MEAHTSGRHCRLSREQTLWASSDSDIMGTFRVSREQLDRSQGLASESQDWDLILTVLCVPSLLDCGKHASGRCCCNVRDLPLKEKERKRASERVRESARAREKERRTISLPPSLFAKHPAACRRRRGAPRGDSAPARQGCKRARRETQWRDCGGRCVCPRARGGRGDAPCRSGETRYVDGVCYGPAQAAGRGVALGAGS